MRCAWAFVTAVLLAIAAPAWAEEAWPQRPVTIVVPFQAGGSADFAGGIAQDVVAALREAGGGGKIVGALCRPGRAAMSAVPRFSESRSCEISLGAICWRHNVR